ncbi:MAG: X2-like carbohydrate binding domain-containing protein [Tenuifilaceae bacterium]|nr:X2-like carbohydrate binding domain-containing protein [Tenuifilaceae bacterium]
MLRGSSEKSKITSNPIPNGIGNFQIKLYKGYTASGDRQVELFINGTSQGTSQIFDDFDEHIFSVYDINILGDIVVEIRNIRSTQVIIDDISWSSYTLSPTININSSSISEFSYIYEQGPSDAQQFMVSGFALEDDITVTAPSNFEISLASDGVFSDEIVLENTSGDVEETLVFVRLGSGLSIGNFNGDINITSTNAENKTISLSGVVTAPKYVVTFSVTDGTNPVQGAVVSVEGYDDLTATNAAGETAIELENGSYPFTANAIGYDEYNSTFSVSNDNLSVAVGLTAVTYDFVEDFLNSNATASYADNSFIGNNDITWSYIQSRNENGDANNSGIDGKALMLRGSSEKSKITSNPIPNGIGNFQIKLYKGYTASGDRQVELFINGISQGCSEPFDDYEEHLFTVYDINIPGNIEIEIRNIKPVQVIIDDISWSSYVPTSPFISINSSAISELFYIYEQGPSDVQQLKVSGFALEDDITITAPSNFEISLVSDGVFSSEVVLENISGEVEETLIYIRLKEGIAINEYTEILEFTSTNAATKQVELKGKVVTPPKTFTETGYQETFSGFTAAGFTPNPSAGQLHSGNWRVMGMSDGDGEFFGTHTSGDFTRGESVGGVTTGGVYAFNAQSNTVLGFQPAGPDFTPGNLTLRLENTSGGILNSIDISYDIYVYNDKEYSSSLNLSYSFDDETYTAIPEADYATPQAADAIPEWVKVERIASINGVNFNQNDILYLKWTSDDVSGTGSRDEFGITNISCTKSSDVYTVTFGIEGGDGNISAEVDSNPITTGTAIAKGKNISFTATASEGYKVKRWIINGLDYTEEGNPYTGTQLLIESIAENISVSVEFEPITYLAKFYVDMLMAPEFSNVYIKGNDNFGGLYEGLQSLTLESQWYVVTLSLPQGSYSYKFYADNVEGAEFDDDNRSVTVSNENIEVYCLWGGKNAAASFSPNARDYDLTNPADVSTSITWYAASSIQTVVNGLTSLIVDEDYSLSENTFTVSQSYLNSLTISEFDVVELTVNFNEGNSQVFTINVTQTPIVNATLNPNRVNVNLSALADVSTTITWGDATKVDKIKNGETVLAAEHYSAVGEVLTINTLYLNSLNINEGDEVSLSVSFDAGNEQPLTLYVLTSASLSPSSVLFDAHNPANLVLEISWNDAESIQHIMQGINELTYGADYVVEANTITILSSYFESQNLSEGDEIELAVSFNIGASALVTVSVIKSAGINPIAATFDIWEPAPVQTVITWNDATAVQSLFYNELELVVGADFSVINIDETAARLTILNDFLLNAPLGELPLTVNFDRGSPSTLSITVTNSTPTENTIGISLIGGSATVETSPAEMATPNTTVTVTIANIEANKEFSSITVEGTSEGPIAVSQVTYGEEYTFQMPDYAVTVTVTLKVKTFPIFNETVGVVTSTTSIKNHQLASGFDNDNLTMTAGDLPAADIRATYSSIGYAAASAGANVFFTGAEGTYGFAIEGISLSNYHSVVLRFAFRKESTLNLPNLSVEYWNGLEYINLPFNFEQANNAATGWYLSPEISLPEAAQIDNLKLRWVKSGNVSVRIDDITLSGIEKPDVLAPVATFMPSNLETGVKVSVTPTISFNEPIFLPSGVAVDNSNVETIISLTNGGNSVNLSTTIANQTITVKPTQNLAYNTRYELLVGSVQDQAGNVLQSAGISFTTEEEKYEVIFSVTTIDGNANGILQATINGSEISSGHLAQAGADAVFTAISNKGYRVKQWVVNGDIIAGFTESEYTISGISQNITLLVEFEVEPNLITSYSVKFNVIQSDGESHGTISARANENSINSGDNVEEGREVVFTATPESGYRLKAWYLNSELMVGFNNLDYTIANLIDDVDVSVKFEPTDVAVSYPVQFSVIEVNGEANGALTATANGSVIISGDWVPQGSNLVFTAAPAQGYELDTWVFNGTEEPVLSLLTVNYDDLNMPLDVKVRFNEKKETFYTVKFGVSLVGGNANGSLTAEANGTAIESGSELAMGTQIVFTANPGNGFRVKEWSVNDQIVSSDISTEFTVENLDRNIAVAVEFEAIPPRTYSVKFSVVGENGQLVAAANGSAIASDDNVDEGSELVFTANPSQGFRIKEWTQNGGIIKDYNENSYSIPELSDDVVITVEFEQLTSSSVSLLSQVKTYPNPFTNTIHIQNAEYITRVMITNLIGKQIIDIRLNGENTINTSSLIEGVYLVILENENGQRVVRKMIKR